MGSIEIARQPQLDQLDPYVLARLLEMEAVLNELTERGFINPHNFSHGLLADLGTGNGAGLLALRRRTLNAIYGVDEHTLVPKFSSYSDVVNETNGSGLLIPCPGVLELSNAQMSQQDVIKFISSQKPNSFSFITMFHTNINHFKFRNNLIDKIGPALTMGGQFLVTSDQDRNWLKKARPKWGIKFTERGPEIIHNHIPWLQPRKTTLPIELISHLGGWDELTKKGVVQKLHGTVDQDALGLFRDRNIWLFTKTTSR